MRARTRPAFGRCGVIGRAVMAAILCSMAASCSAAEPVTGTARAYDGDGIYVYRSGSERVKVRLWGIDAPELGTPPGERSYRALQRIDGQPVECRPPPGHWRYPVIYDRIVARCINVADGADLARAQIERGFAQDWPRYSKGYYSQ